MSRFVSILAMVAIIMGFLPLALTPSPAAAATEWDVYPGQTIQAAIDSASAGDTIIVHPGTYNEQIVVNKQLTIKSSDNANVTMIDGGLGTANEFQLPFHPPPPLNPPPGPAHVYKYYPVVRIDAAGVVFQDLTVRGVRPITDPLPLEGPVPYECGIAIAVRASNCRVQNSIIPGSVWGIFVQGSSNIISGNAIPGLLNASDISVCSLEGVYVLGDDNQIGGNTISVGALGVFVVGKRNSITGNTASSGYAGITVWAEGGWASSYNEISGNEVYDTSNTAISVEGNSHCVISGNTISKKQNNWAGYEGIALIGASYCQVKDNTISDVVLDGIGLQRSNYNELSGNTMSNFVACEIEKVGAARLQWTGERVMFGLTSAKVYSGDSPGDGTIIKLPYSSPLSYTSDDGPMFWAYLYDVNARPRVNFVLDLYGDGSAYEVMEGVDTHVVCPDYWEPQVGCDLVEEAWRAMSPTGGYYDSDNSLGKGWDANPATMDQWKAEFPNSVITEVQTVYGMWDSMSGKTAYLDGHFDGDRWGLEQSAQGISYWNSYYNTDRNNTIAGALITGAGREDIVGAQTNYTVAGPSGSDTSITVTTTKDVTVTVTCYADNPEPAVPFPDTALGKFVDIQVSDNSAISWPVRVEMTYTAAEVTARGIDENNLAVYYWSYESGAFERCSDTGVDKASRTIWAEVKEEEASRLVGTPFAAGGGTIVAQNDIYKMNEGGTLGVSAPGVLVNDSDPSSDPLTTTLVSTATHGTLILHADGSFTYTPTACCACADSFTYRATDGAAESNIATTTIQINDAPVALDDAYSMNEGTTFSVTAPGVLGNDADADSGAITAILVSNVSHGILALAADGSLAYSPDATFTGIDSFTYKANDGGLDSNVAVVTFKAAPTLVSVDPLQYRVGKTYSVSITGANLTGATDLDFGQGISVNSYTVGGPTQITAEISITAITAGSGYIRVTSPAGTATLADAFTVVQELPTLVSIDTIQYRVGKTYSVIITGANLTEVTDLDFGQGISVNSYNVDSPTQITAKIAVAQGATLGARDVRVTTPTGSSILADAITIEESSSQGLAPRTWALIGLAIFFIAGGMAVRLLRRRSARPGLGVAHPTEAGTGPMAAEPKTTEVQAGVPSATEATSAKEERTKKETRKKRK